MFFQGVVVLKGLIIYDYEYLFKGLVKLVNLGNHPWKASQSVLRFSPAIGLNLKYEHPCSSG